MPAKLSEQKKAGILVALGNGATQQAIATEFKVSRNTVSHLRALGQAAGHAALNPLAHDWREVQIGKAVVAVNAGLDAEQDPYKRGQLGATVLKGHGVLNNDTTVKLEAHFTSAGAKQVMALHAAMTGTPTDTPANSE